MNIDTLIALCALLITAGGLLVTLGKIITTQSQLHDQGEEFKSILSDQAKTIVQVQLSMSSLQSQFAMIETYLKKMKLK